MKRKILLIFMAVIVSFVVSTAVKASFDTFKSWSWGGSDDGATTPISSGVGWISLNSENCDLDNNGFVDVACSGNNTTTTGDSYQVVIPDVGEISGKAWSSNIGWVSFNAGDLTGCPAAPCTASRSGDNITGWARILSIKEAAAVGNSGGWDGWIKLNGTTQDGSTYGVTVDPVKNELNGYAWSGSNVAGSHELGWIKFDNFLVKNLSVTVGLNGNVTSTPAGINCSSGAGSCDHDFDTGTSVTLKATPLPGTTFMDWGGACDAFTASQDCVLTMDSDKSAIADFCTPVSCDLSTICSDKTCTPTYCDGTPGSGIPVAGTKTCVTTGGYQEVAP